MNAKKAKRLRRQARVETVGKPRKLYTAERQHTKLFQVHNSNGEKKIVGQRVATFKLHPESTQGRLRQLKKESRRAR